MHMRTFPPTPPPLDYPPCTHSHPPHVPIRPFVASEATRLATRVPRGSRRGLGRTRRSRRSGACFASHAVSPGPSTPHQLAPSPRPSLPNRSLGSNRIGDEGAARLAEWLKDNSRLTTLGCTPHLPSSFPRPSHPAPARTLPHSPLCPFADSMTTLLATRALHDWRRGTWGGCQWVRGGQAGKGGVGGEVRTRAS